MTKYTLIRVSDNGERIYRKNEPRYEPPTPFKQWIKLNRKHIHGLQAQTLTMEELREQGVIEYITADEQENTFIAPSLDDLRAHRSDITTQYTHCDVEQAIFGLLAMSSPANNHTNTTRTTYHTNQRKQTCSWFSLNWPYRISDKNVFLQNYCDMPLVKTLSDDLTYPAGQNVIVAFMCVGDNQEDSSIVCKQSIERGMFTGSFFNFKETRLEKGEQFGNPEPEKTMGRKSNAIYDYIDENGFIKPGTIVKKGYVLVVKVARMPKPTPEFVYIDKSVVYREHEPAIVELVVHPHDDEGAQICKIKLRAIRPLKVGDKLSSRTGNKSICARIVDEVDMPYDERGLRPDIIINPHSIPTRMAIGQTIEGVVGLLAAAKGTIIDATGFRKFDIDATLTELKKYGIKNSGMRRMFNGRTGNWFDSFIFTVPNTYQRLMKFAIEQAYAVHRAPTHALTHQPLDGQANDGGLKIGEMEAWVYTAQGASRSLYEKMYNHSDGKDIYICRNCGTRSVVNEARGIYICKMCGDDADICKVASSWASNLFMNEAEAMNVDMELKLNPFTYSVKET
jgi:DNA-directed RNA polymerase beta subunit